MTNKNTSAAGKSAADKLKDSKANLVTLETAKNDALKAFTELDDTSSDVDREAAEKLMNDTLKAWETASAEHQQLEGKNEAKTKKVKILLPVAGRFLLADNVGDVVEYPANQAQELVDAKYAKFVK